MKPNSQKITLHLIKTLNCINKCDFLNQLSDKGFVKASNFKNNRNKKAYVYLLTQKGIVEKARATTRFLARKIEEYEVLQREIENLKREVRIR